MNYKLPLLQNQSCKLLKASEVAISLFVALLPGACSPDYEDEKEAYDLGDYKTAREIYEIQGLNGYAEAQFHLGLMFFVLSEVFAEFVWSLPVFLHQFSKAVLSTWLGLWILKQLRQSP
jgi:hypothetical protein